MNYEGPLACSSNSERKAQGPSNEGRPHLQSSSGQAQPQDVTLCRPFFKEESVESPGRTGTAGSRSCSVEGNYVCFDVGAKKVMAPISRGELILNMISFPKRASSSIIMWGA